MKPVTQSKPAQEQQVQLALFSRGDAISNRFAEALVVVDRVKKGKDKKVIKDAEGNPVVSSQTLKLLPKSSKEGESLKDLTGLTGQALMGFELEARGALLQSSFSHLSKLVASGNYTFDVARCNLSNGKFMLQIKPAIGKSPILTPEQLAEQSKALGYKLVPIDPEPTESAPATDGETELVTSKKGKGKSNKAKPAVSHKPAIVSQPAA